MGVWMMKEYFEIEVSKAIPQYRFQKEINLFGDESYQVSKDELEKNLLGRGYIDMLSTCNVTWDIRKQMLGCLIFLKRKRSRKTKGRGSANARP